MMKIKKMRMEIVLLWPLFCPHFFYFSFWRKTHAWIPGKYDVLSNCIKIQQLQLSLEEKSSFFAAPEVVSEFSAAWYLSIVGQASPACPFPVSTLAALCSVWVRNNFAGLSIVDGSWAVIRIVAASQIKAVELDVQWWLISTSNCFSSCFLHAPVRDPFY